MVEVLAQLPLIDELGERHGRGAVDDPEGHARVAVTPEDHLRHQELVEIGVEHRADDRIDLPGVVVDPGRDVGHGPQRPSSSGSKPAFRVQPYNRRKSMPLAQPADLCTSGGSDRAWSMIGLQKPSQNAFGAGPAMVLPRSWHSRARPRCAPSAKFAKPCAPERISH